MFSEDSGLKEKPVIGVEEVNLVDYLKEIDNIPILTREQERDLAKRIRKGDEQALKQLIRANLRYVASVAKQYVDQGLSLADLINEGNLGLIKAAYRFDEKRGFKFISYAVWWIRQAMLMALAEQSRIVRLPLNRSGTLYRVGKATRSLDQKLGRNPTGKEVAEELSIEPFDEANAEPSNDESYVSALTDDMQKALDRLKPREREILEQYFGIKDNEPRTLEEIGKQMDLSRDEVRKIKDKAILRLRRLARGK